MLVQEKRIIFGLGDMLLCTQKNQSEKGLGTSLTILHTYKPLEVLNNNYIAFNSYDKTLKIKELGIDKIDWNTTINLIEYQPYELNRVLLESFHKYEYIVPYHNYILDFTECVNRDIDLMLLISSKVGKMNRRENSDGYIL